MCKKDVIKILVGSLNQAGMKVADYLKKQGYNVAQSDYNPLEIQLEVLKSKPDFLIVSEITEFPYELCKNLKGACPKLKIIMLSDRKNQQWKQWTCKIRRYDNKKSSKLCGYQKRTQSASVS